VIKPNKDSLLKTDLKVGILFNVVVRSSKGVDLHYVSEAEVKDQVEYILEALEKLKLEHQVFPLKDDIESLIRALKQYKPDVIVNLCEGAFGKSRFEMDVASTLELLGMTYTGSPPLTLGLCQNKGLAKEILRARGIPTPAYQILSCFENWNGEIGYPLFVKPLKEDASLGIAKESFVRNDIELKKRVEYITEHYRQPALVEEYIDGRELNVSIVGNETPVVLPISEIMFEFLNDPKIVDYSAKWVKESDEYKKTKPICPAKLNPSIKDKVEWTALQAYMSLHCRDYARVDIRLKYNVPYVLEVNPNPDISLEAGFVRSLKAAGISFSKFVKDIICFALER
jgi:D-alanine-D-alanine ligase